MSRGEDGMGWVGMDLREREDVDEAVWDMYIPCQPGGRGSQTLLCSLCAPNLRRRADIFSTPGQASKTTICSGSRGLRQCAEALDGVSGVSTGKRYRRGETPLSAHYPKIDAMLPVCSLPLSGAFTSSIYQGARVLAFHPVLADANAGTKSKPLRTMQASPSPARRTTRLSPN